jgi:hypothetical protein
VAIAWRGKPFAGSTGQARADKFEVDGLNIGARKP